MVRRRSFLAVAAAVLLTARRVSGAQAARVYRIGLLTIGPPAPPSGPAVAFRERLRDLGYIEGRNLTFLLRFADGRAERLPALAAELAAENPDLIVVVGPGPVHAAKAATRTIPIVMLAGSSDPVAEGLVESMARPGGNITGLTYAVSAERFGKQIELLKEAFPRLATLGVLWDLDRALFTRQWAPALNEAGTRLGVRVAAPTHIRTADDLGPAFEALKRQGVDAVLLVSGGVAFGVRDRIAQLALHHRLPTMAAFREFVQAGALASYGPNIIEIYRRGAVFVDKILRGAKPADLPIEQPPTYELGISVVTARALGITIPQALLLRADHVIE